MIKLFEIYCLFYLSLSWYQSGLIPPCWYQSSPSKYSPSVVIVFSGIHRIWSVSPSDDQPCRSWKQILLHVAPRAHSWFVVVRCVTSRQTSWSLFWPRVLHFRHGLRPNLGFSICLLVVVSSLSVSTVDNVFCTCCLLLRNSHHYFWKIQLEKLSLLGCLNWT